uniref:2Fe-2S ferredoxin-type domain-containing protein n=1 Tax=Aureoumbra lagunensis TaxID=44058 RepID=A0A7S3JUU5_9STRA
MLNCWRRHIDLKSDAEEDSYAQDLPPDYDLVMAAKDKEAKRQIQFKVNGHERIVVLGGQNITLAEYLREYEYLTGVKLSCQEGGCGVCQVLLSIEGQSRVLVNSCLRKLAACDGCEIWTNQGLGTPIAPSKVQQALIDCDGSQCGFCSSGMVTALTYALEQPNVSAQDIEAITTGNLCRCTSCTKARKNRKKIFFLGFVQ